MRIFGRSKITKPSAFRRTGSSGSQAAEAAGVIGAAFSLKLFWAKIKLAIAERFGGAKSGPEADDRG